MGLVIAIAISGALCFFVMCAGMAYAGAPGKTYPQKFNDVPKSHWAFEQISALSENGVINGYVDGGFRPDTTVSRAEWAKILVESAYLPLSSANHAFADMAGHWANPWVNVVRPYMAGYDGGASFRPDAAALREDVIVSLIKIKGYNVENVDTGILSNFTDYGDISDGNKKYIAVAVKNGLVAGYEDGTFRAGETLTRAEAATLLWRSFNF